MKKVSDKRLLRIIDKYDVISFDIFDTLIKRNCLNPVDIFEICEIIYNSDKSKISNFKNIRINAEIYSRKNSITEEITLDEIYKNIKYDNLDKEKMKKIEIDTEIKFCVSNIFFKEIYNYCIQKKKRVLFVSDMYLDESVILKILSKNGYNKGTLYLSSKYKVTKHSGGLYDVVLKNENIKPKQILHIGDSKRADFLSPLMKGIRAYKISKNIKNTSYIPLLNKNINDNVLYSFINNNVINMNDYEKIGFELLGPICYSFCNWAHNTANKNNVKKLFFCSRDMQFIQKAYNIIYQDDAIYNKYFYVSRKSLRLPYFYVNNDFDSFFKMIPDKKMKMKDILNNFNLKVSDEIIAEYGFGNGEYNCCSLKNDKRFIKFYNEVIKKHIKNNDKIKEQYDCFMQYLNNIGFDKNSAIVDLGWKGTTQYSMNRILKHDIRGIYFGLEKNSFKEIEKQSYTFIFNRNDDGILENKIYSFRSLFEILFACQDGSTIKYSNGSKPYILGEPDNLDSKVLNDIQNSAIKFVELFSKYDITLYNNYEILDEFIRIGINPNYRESVIFGDLNFDNMINGYLAKPKKMINYILNPKELKRDAFSSEWKVGFVKRLLKIKLPYYLIYSKLKKFKNGGNN